MVAEKPSDSAGGSISISISGWRVRGGGGGVSVVGMLEAESVIGGGGVLIFLQECIKIHSLRQLCFHLGSEMKWNACIRIQSSNELERAECLAENLFKVWF